MSLPTIVTLRLELAQFKEVITAERKERQGHNSCMWDRLDSDSNACSKRHAALLETVAAVETRALQSDVETKVLQKRVHMLEMGFQELVSTVEVFSVATAPILNNVVVFDDFKGRLGALELRFLEATSQAQGLTKAARDLADKVSSLQEAMLDHTQKNLDSTELEVSSASGQIARVADQLDSKLRLDVDEMRKVADGRITDLVLGDMTRIRDDFGLLRKELEHVRRQCSGSRLAADADGCGEALHAPRGDAPSRPAAAGGTASAARLRGDVVKFHGELAESEDALAHRGESLGRLEEAVGQQGQDVCFEPPSPDAPPHSGGLSQKFCS